MTSLVSLSYKEKIKLLNQYWHNKTKNILIMAYAFLGFSLVFCILGILEELHITTKLEASSFYICAIGLFCTVILFVVLYLIPYTVLRRKIKQYFLEIGMENAETTEIVKVQENIEIKDCRTNTVQNFSQYEIKKIIVYKSTLAVEIQGKTFVFPNNIEIRGIFKEN